ncbi:hypothetical protein V6N13_063907 [Hibiscus sabdariffa]|uniref:Pentatricopeptide repeat-containing protein n=1 Tax=Hibiscus sabdariffa TaxID=183260 RepID=A0ABR2R1J8_9ROSI
MVDRNPFFLTGFDFGYVAVRQVEEGILHFEQMPESENVVTWTSVVLGYARNGLGSSTCLNVNRAYETVLSLDSMPKTTDFLDKYVFGFAETG